jgi:hypothetical protein
MDRLLAAIPPMNGPTIIGEYFGQRRAPASTADDAIFFSGCRLIIHALQDTGLLKNKLDKKV